VYRVKTHIKRTKAITKGNSIDAGRLPGRNTGNSNCEEFLSKWLFQVPASPKS